MNCSLLIACAGLQSPFFYSLFRLLFLDCYQDWSGVAYHPLFFSQTINNVI